MVSLEALSPARPRCVNAPPLSPLARHSIQTSTIGVVENLGKFSRIVPAGMTCIMCPLESVVGRVSLRVQQLDVPCETKTKASAGAPPPQLAALRQHVR